MRTLVEGVIAGTVAVWMVELLGLDIPLWGFALLGLITGILVETVRTRSTS